MNDRSLSGPEIVWDNVRPTDNVRLVASQYQCGRAEGIAAVVRWLEAAACHSSHEPRKRDFLLETARALRDEQGLI